MWTRGHWRHEFVERDEPSTRTVQQQQSAFESNSGSGSGEKVISGHTLAHRQVQCTPKKRLRRSERHCRCPVAHPSTTRVVAAAETRNMAMQEALARPSTSGLFDVGKAVWRMIIRGNGVTL
jgi:hypothetical protein